MQRYLDLFSIALFVFFTFNSLLFEYLLPMQLPGLSFQGQCLAGDNAGGTGRIGWRDGEGHAYPPFVH